MATQEGLRERLALARPGSWTPAASPDETRERVEEALAEALAPAVDILPFGSVDR